MAKTEGYIQLVCDRCGKTIYTQPSSPDAQSWRQLRRISADQVDVSRLLCADCYTEYRDIAAKQDQEFGDFMARKKEKPKEEPHRVTIDDEPDEVVVHDN